MNSPGEPEVAAAKRRAVTLQDVADEADVAVSTASRALSNPDRVSATTVAEFWNSTGLFSTATADFLYCDCGLFAPMPGSCNATGCDPVVRRSGGLLLNVAAGSLFNRRQLGVA